MIGRIAVLGAVAVAGTRCGSHDGTPAAATRPDSAGWRFASVTSVGLDLRYPRSRVRDVQQQSTADCASSAPILASFPDSSQNGVLVVTERSGDFDRVAKLAGFEREERDATIVCTGDGCAAERWVLKDDGPFYFREYAQVVDVGRWRALTGLAVFAGYFDDDEPDTIARADDEPDVRRMPEEIYQGRVFAMTSSGTGCAVVLAWRGEVVRASKGGEAGAAWDSSALRLMLAGSVVRP